MVASMGSVAGTRIISEREMTAGREFCFGKGVVDLKPYTFDPDAVPNSHILVAGKSQSGKTRTTKKLIEYYGKEKDGYRKSVYVLDFSGDMDVPNENVISILARKSKYGISLFEFSKDHESGGIRVARDNIIRMIDRYFMNSGMGTVQKAVLERLITDTYALKGIYEVDESSWNNDLPIIDDMLNLMVDIRESIEMAFDVSLQAQIRKDTERIRSLNNRISVADNDTKIKKLQEDRDMLKDILLENINKYVEWRIVGEQLGREKPRLQGVDKVKADVSFYSETNAFNALRDLRIHIEKIVESRAFSASRPPVINGINRFDLSKLSVPLQKLFTDILIMRIYLKVRERGKYSEFSGRVPGYKIDTVVVIDEAKLVIPMNKKDREARDEPINLIVSQSLKFGMAIVLASQRLDHFSQEILSNVHTKLIFEMGVNDYGSAKSILGIKENDTSFTRKFGVGLLFSGSNPAIPIALPWAKL
jgi:DNA helicase HerA-like ATPase